MGNHPIQMSLFKPIISLKAKSQQPSSDQQPVELLAYTRPHLLCLYMYNQVGYHSTDWATLT